MPAQILPPGSQRGRVMCGDVVHRRQCQASGVGDRAPEQIERGEAATGEDVELNEIDRAAIRFEQSSAITIDCSAMRPPGARRSRQIEK
jgi:hypothetical protein